MSDMDALAAAAASEAQQQAQSSGRSGGTVLSDSLMNASSWFQKKGESKPKSKSSDRKSNPERGDGRTSDMKWFTPKEADPNRGRDEDGALLGQKDVDKWKPKKTVAEDGQSLVSQSPGTQAQFRLKYGSEAEFKWVEEHEQELATNRRMYGVSEPPAYMKKQNPPPYGATAPSASTESSTASSPPRTTASGQLTALLPMTPATYQAPQTVVTPGQPGQIPTTFGPAASATSPSTPGTPPPTAQTPTTPTTDPESTVVIRNKNTGVQYSVKRKMFGDSRVPGNGVTYTPSDGWELATPEPQAATAQPTGQSVNMSANAIAMPANTIDIDVKPVDLLARNALKKQGGSLDNAPAESQRILQGIGSLIRGETEGAWAEPYLNDIARIAWARQARESGETVDPRNAPLDYIEKWKDAFYGSDATVPLVKELDQQMIDNAVTRTPTGGKVFDWQKAYGPTGENGLISRQIASNDCGPNAWATMVRSRGYNVDPGQAFDYAKSKGYHDGDQFQGPQMFARMLKQEAGLDSEVIPLDWKAIDAELDAKRPVALSSSTHYWTASAYRDTENGREYYVGATGAVVGNPVWARADQLISAGASPNVAIVARGEVDPNARGITELGLRPPGLQNPGRAALSTETIRMSQTQGSSTQPAPINSMGTVDDLPNVLKDSPAAPFAPIIQQYATQYKTDPILVAAILEQESNGRTDALSGQGAGGLMQLMGPTAKQLGVDDVNDPDQNIRGGTDYISQMMRAFGGDAKLALAAYNAGPGSVLAHDGVPPYKETQDYVVQVNERYKRLSGGRSLY